MKPADLIQTFHVVLYTDDHGFARFRKDPQALTEGNPMSRLSALAKATGVQFRYSPVGFRSDFHCTTHPQWLIVLAGEMEIGLQDGSVRRFRAGEYFFSADMLPEGAVFNPKHHGHCSRQIGQEPLRTMFVRI